MKTKYVLGFLFTESGDEVILIKKNKPDWQKGLLNGVGGKIEDGETPIEAMRREFEEEAGVKVEDWNIYLVHTGDHHIIYIFRAFVDHPVYDACKTMEEEEIVKVPVAYLKNFKTVHHLTWVLNMALDKEIFMANVIITPQGISH